MEPVQGIWVHILQNRVNQVQADSEAKTHNAVMFDLWIRLKPNYHSIHSSYATDAYGPHNI